MARENKVILNGQISSIRKVRDNETKEIIKIYIGLMTVRRPDNSKRLNQRDVKTDFIQIIVCDKGIIRYLAEKKAAPGDMLEAFGVLCTVRAIKSFFCGGCGKKNDYEGTVIYVHPLCVNLYTLHPKNVETVVLTAFERGQEQREVMETVRKKKANPGKIIAIKELGENEGNYYIQITVQENPSDDEVIQWLRRMDEISNRALLIGNLCDDPIYNPKENGGRICSYELGISRNVFIQEDDPEAKADYIWIKSLGDQADKDHVVLAKGSQVSVDGSIQARDGFKVKKECAFCGEVNEVPDVTMEVVPYYVEYLRNCMVDYLNEEDGGSQNFDDEEFDAWGDEPEENFDEAGEDNPEGDGFTEED